MWYIFTDMKVRFFVMKNCQGSRVILWTSKWSISYTQNTQCIVSGQIIIFHQPRFAWNKEISLPKRYILEVKIGCVRLKIKFDQLLYHIYFHLGSFFMGKLVNEPLSHLGYHGCFHRNPWEPRYASYIVLWPHESPTKITGKTLPAKIKRTSIVKLNHIVDGSG